MTSNNFFTKVAVCTDQHFGRSNSSVLCNQDNLDFLEWFVDEARTRDIDTCVLAGDYFDNRSSIQLSTLDYAVKGLELLGSSFKRVFAIPGNHDLMYRNKRSVSSMVFSKHLPNINYINEPLVLDGVTFLPWLLPSEKIERHFLDSRYVFGHLELASFMMNARVPMPNHSGALDADDLPGPEFVFTGHYHFRQTQKNILYMGNIMPFNFADAWDADRGAMFLEWGKDPEFKAWPDQPLFRTMKLSDLLDKPDTLLKQKLTARVSLDIDISFEEAQFIRDTFVASHGLRKMELVHQSRESESDQEFSEDVVFQSVDQIVTEGLMSLETREIKPDVLVDIYKNLPVAL